MNSVLVRPIISEKSLQEAKTRKFTFHVGRFATKHAIKKAVEDTFTVNVTAISTNVVKGRTKRTGSRRKEVTEAQFKKARVTLKEGQKIAIFEVSG